MKRNQRYETRLEKRKQNRFLNIAIGLVVLLIVVVAFNLFSGDDNETASTNETKQTADKKESNNNNSIEMEKDDSDSKQEEESANKEDTNEEAEKEETEAEQPAGGGPEGPWEPIGTSQAEPHQKSYDDGSQDWNEMVQALSYATNIPQDQMTIFWLGNGGGPDLSKGTVKSKADGAKYEVMLQWVPEKGWQPTSVTPVQ